MNRNTLLAGAGVVVLAACSPPPPANPMEAHARRAVAAEFAATRCAGQVGGYAGVQQMRADANRNAATARQMGATDEDFESARTTVAATYNTAVAFTNPQVACNDLVGSLAWVMGS